MIKGIFQAGRNLQVGEKQISVISNNLANMGTSGYKKELPFYQILSENGKTTTNQVTDLSAGERIFTGNPLDLAIKGNAYFTVETDSGERLTRDGKFTISQEGFLTNRAGDKIVGEGGGINLKDIMTRDNAQITITNEGMVMVGDKVVDKLMIMKERDGTKLLKDYGVYFQAENDGFIQLEPEDYQVDQGFLENSNVNPMDEMENMISLSKNYESAKNILTYLDESLEKANQIGKVF
ncbi:MAG: flagellar hook basal-body protein [Bacteroidetes bacterium]|nr:flagellar hook basal-body protein [Bacteroidota bacterium]MBU1115120.1 flagellar hook basal-body protein [Bacteroidota bacterium]MBU1799259.1 flagellar hook basal-body protein [Bacteroidota bacterium]